jgi:hypothetical protein
MTARPVKLQAVVHVLTTVVFAVGNIATVRVRSHKEAASRFAPVKMRPEYLE